jgi:hypothetical protein
MWITEPNDGPGKTMSGLRYTLSIIAILLFAGCQTEQPFEAKKRVCREDIKKSELMRVAKDVLSEMYFDIEKADIEHGVIKTKPLPGAQFFEVWRSDNIGEYNTAEANLHSIVRTAQLTFSRNNNQLCVECIVKIHRLSLPEEEVNSTARAYCLFFENTGSLQKLKLSGRQMEQMAWLDMGRDERLETEIINRIEKQITNFKNDIKLCEY